MIRFCCWCRFFSTSFASDGANLFASAMETKIKNDEKSFPSRTVEGAKKWESDLYKNYISDLSMLKEKWMGIVRKLRFYGDESQKREQKLQAQNLRLQTMSSLDRNS